MHLQDGFRPGAVAHRGRNAPVGDTAAERRIDGIDTACERELAEHREEVDGLYRMIGQLTAERDYLQRSVLKRYGVDVDKDLPGRPGK